MQGWGHCEAEAVDQEGGQCEAEAIACKGGDIAMMKPDSNTRIISLFKTSKHQAPFESSRRDLSSYEISLGRCGPWSLIRRSSNGLGGNREAKTINYVVHTSIDPIPRLRRAHGKFVLMYAMRPTNPEI
jgi:hypothetical protein